MKQLMSAYQIAKYLDITATTIYNWVKMGLPYKEEKRGLKTVKMFDIQEVKKWIKERG